MDFRTIYKPTKAPFEIDYQSSILGIGSCFAQNMGQKLSKLRFQTALNPFGIVYNPLSMAQQLTLLRQNALFSRDNLFEHGGLWHSWLHHGQFSHATAEATLASVNQQLSAGHAFLQKTNRLILTLGSATVYALRETGETVANCHKVPPQYFEKKRLSVAEITEKVGAALAEMSAQKHDFQIIVTVSPVRHLRDGMVENNRSKAALLLAAEALTQCLPNVHYFPAYEIVMDDLRDYRFYETDMFHPTPQAVEYIWQIFAETYFSKNTQRIVHDVRKVNAMRQHRPLHDDTEGYRRFQAQLAEAEMQLQTRYPFLKI